MCMESCQIQVATMKDPKDVQTAAANFTEAHPDLCSESKALPLTRRQAREEMQGLPRYPARPALRLCAALLKFVRRACQYRTCMSAWILQPRLCLLRAAKTQILAHAWMQCAAAGTHACTLSSLDDEMLQSMQGFMPADVLAPQLMLRSQLTACALQLGQAGLGAVLPGHSDAAAQPQ